MAKRVRGTTIEDLQAKAKFADDLLDLMRKHGLIRTRKPVKPAPKPVQINEPAD